MKKISALQTAREKSGKTQAQAAEELGMSKQMYQKYEYGVGEQTIKTAIKIAKFYNTSVEQIWDTQFHNNYMTTDR